MRLVVFFLVVGFGVSALLPTVRGAEGDLILDVVQAAGLPKEVRVPKTINRAVGWNGAGQLVPLPVGGEGVTLAGSLDYLTISGQTLTRNPIDLGTDVTGSLPWAAVTGRPTTLAGYGITDAATSAQGALADSALQPGSLIPWLDITDPPTTLSGYGITDAASLSDLDGLRVPTGFVYVDPQNGDPDDADGSIKKPYPTLQAAYEDHHYKYLVFPGDAGTLEVAHERAGPFWIYGYEAGDVSADYVGDMSLVPASQWPAAATTQCVVSNDAATTNHCHIYSNQNIVISLRGHSTYKLGPEGNWDVIGADFFVANALVGDVTGTADDGSDNTEQPSKGGNGLLVRFDNCTILGNVNLDVGVKQHEEEVGGVLPSDGSGAGLTAWRTRFMGSVAFASLPLATSNLNVAHSVLSQMPTGTFVADYRFVGTGDGVGVASKLPLPTVNDLGGVRRNTGSAGQFVTGISAGGALQYGTPAGGSPAGSGSELQFRSGATAFGAVTNSSVSSGAITLGQAEALGTTPTARLILRNTTAAANNAQQVSPAIVSEGRGWRTNATAESQIVRFRQFAQPVQGTANPSVLYSFQGDVNDSGTWGAAFSITAGGNIRLAGDTQDTIGRRSDINTLVIGGGAVATHSTAIGMSSGTFAGVRFGNSASLGWTNDTPASSADVLLSRVGTAHLAMTAGTTAQRLSVANTWTSTTNHEVGVMDWRTTTGVLRIGTDKGSGAGSARDVHLITGGTNRLTIDALGRIIPVLPTSADGLPSGALWNDGGTVKVAP